MRLLIPSLLSLFAVPLFAQTTALEAYVFETGNRGYLQQAKVNVYEITSNRLVAELSTNENGRVEAELPSGATYRIFTKKDIFNERNDTIIASDSKAFLKIELSRKPGYLFDVTLAEVRNSVNESVDAIEGARLEIYNNTTKKLELLRESLPGPYFQFTFEQGNYYTILIRKQGYLARRIEAHVNIDGCIICIDGVNNLRPGVTDNLTAGHTMGTLLANIDMQKAKVEQKIKANHIQYANNSADITQAAATELDKMVVMLKANPEYQFELGSHTDSKGNDIDNLDLSRRRAESAVAYLVQQGIEPERLKAKGYGENYIQNKCKNGINCTEEEHSENRRTEMTILGVFNDSKEFVPLQEILRLEAMEKARKELLKQDRVEVKVPVSAKVRDNTVDPVSSPTDINHPLPVKIKG
jgi:outer membrane protein OmpA-like peptidoglycan-associated protein